MITINQSPTLFQSANVTATLGSPSEPAISSSSSDSLGPLGLPAVLFNATDSGKKSVPRKGTPGIIKARKGAILDEIPTLTANLTTTTTTTTAQPSVALKATSKVHNSKPVAASEGTEELDSTGDQPDYTALIVGLSLGIALVLVLAAITYWRMRDVWERRQYKRVDFLIDGMYADT